MASDAGSGKQFSGKFLMSLELVLILGQRFWQALAGLVTVVLVASFLSPDEQGWYYTFVSIAALYSVFEMGLSTALVQISGHLFQGLHWLPYGNLTGNKSIIFKSFLGQTARLYIFLAVIFALLVFFSGFAYFSLKSEAAAGSIDWHGAWLVLVLATAGALMTLPLLSIVEGTGNIIEVYLVRIVQGVVGAVSCWVLLANGASIWATVAVPLMATFVTTSWMLTYRRNTIYLAISVPDQMAFDWKAEIWPLQWRVGISWVGAYFMSQLATPILFYFQGSVVAGQMGLSLTVTHMIGLLAQASIARVVPAMSVAVLSNSWKELDNLFRRGMIGFIVLFSVGVTAAIVAYSLLRESTYIVRILPASQMIELGIFVFFFQINAALGTQLRAFRRDALAWVYAIGSVLSVAGSIAIAQSSSSAGVIQVMLFVQVGFIFPLSLFLWFHNLSRWRNHN